MAASPASAQGRPGANKSAAEQLFLDGRRLLDEGHYAEACEKLARSQSLDPSAGTLLNLADCHEKNGQLASAWSAFREAARAASDRKRSDWERLAARRAGLLEPRLAFLSIGVRGQPPEGFRVTYDGSPVPPDAFGTAVPRDLGIHVVEATAPGWKPWRSEVRLASAGRSEVVVPPLVADGAVAPPPPPPPRQGARAVENEPPRTQRTIGIVVGAVGLAALGTGGIFGLLASGALGDAKDACLSYPVGCTSPDATSANDDARTFSTLSTVGVIGGGVLVAGGLALFLTAPRAPTVGALRLAPWMDARTTGLAFHGTL